MGEQSAYGNRARQRSTSDPWVPRDRRALRAVATGSAPRPTGRNGLVNFPDCEGAIANVAGSAGNTPLNGHGVIALTDGGFEC